jgi:hypothetical protein
MAARQTSVNGRPHVERDEPEQVPQPFTAPLLGALYASTVVVVVIFILSTGLGRRLEDRLDAPARTLIAAPVITLAVIVFCACMVALIQPAYRSQSMRVAEITGWLIPAWLLMAATTLGAIAYALDHVS